MDKRSKLLCCRGSEVKVTSLAWDLTHPHHDKYQGLLNKKWVLSVIESSKMLVYSNTGMKK